MDSLEIGCGPKNRWTPVTDGIDLIDFGQKYTGDFLTYKFPQTYKVIYAHHVIEHVPDTVAFFNKVGEVLENGGTIDIRVPTLPYDFAFVDPTHVKFIPNEMFFQYFTKDSPAGHCYSKDEFEIVYVERDRFEWELHLSMRKK
jgi:predicted SAM-dependent methyltransferase